MSGGSSAVNRRMQKGARLATLGVMRASFPSNYILTLRSQIYIYSHLSHLEVAEWGR